MPVSETNRHADIFRPTPLFPVEAQQLLASGQVKRAIEVCKRGLVYFPSQIMGYAVLAQAYIVSGEKLRALNVLRDGHRRTGAEQLDLLRAQIAGEGPAYDDYLRVEIEEAHEAVATGEGGRNPLIEKIAERIDALETGLPLPSTAGPVETVQAEVAPAREEEQVTAPVAEPPLPDEQPAQEQPVPEKTVREKPVLEKPAPEQPVQEQPLQEKPAPEKEREPQRIMELMDRPVSGERIDPVVPQIEPEGVRAPEPERVTESIITSESDTQRARQEHPVKTYSLRALSELERSLPMATPEAPAEGAGTEERTEKRAEGESQTGRTLGMLALHHGGNMSRLRSSNLRLIPGLEFAPLRHEDNQKRQPLAPLINEPMPEPFLTGRRKVSPPLPPIEETLLRKASPPLPPIEETMLREEPAPPIAFPGRRSSGPIAPAQQSAPAPPEKKSEELTPLEELARRLENARIPVVEEEDNFRPSSFEPSIVSDTLANILVTQRAYAEALKAYQTLARSKPERLEYYEERIAEMKEKMRGRSAPEAPEATETGDPGHR